MGMLDLSALGGKPFGGLLDSLSDPLNSVPGYSMRAESDPYKEADKKKANEAAAVAEQSVFDQGAPSVPAAGISGQQAMVPGAYGSLAPAPAAAPPVAPPVPSITMPAPRPAAVPPSTVDDTTQRAQGTSGTTDISSQSRTPAEDASAIPETSALGRLKKFGSDNSNMLMAMAAGFAGAPSLGTGMSRAFSGATAGSQLDIKQAMQQGAIGPTYTALVKAGVPKEQALAAVYNPEMLKSVVQSYITDRGQDIKMIKTKDSWGNEREVPYVVNKFPKDGEPVMKPAFMGKDGTASPVPGQPQNTQTFAPGITQDNFDHTKLGEDYLKQFSPEMQASIHAYQEGRALPTGRQLPMQMIKMAAQKYGDDIGMPADDASITQRKQWSSSLGDIKSGVGLASKGFKQGLEHFVKLSDNLVKMNLSNGLGLEPIAGVINGAKNLTTEQQELVHKSDVIGQALSREMGNLFSKNGGGVHEAAETKKNVSNSTMSSKAAAGSLEAIDELMQGGLKTLEQRRDELFPNGNAPKGSQFLGPEQEKALEHIRHNIAILKGERPATQEPGAAAQALPTATGPNGHKIIVQNGRWVDAQTGKPVE